MMYKLKPIISYEEEISLPKCMYPLKNINGYTSGFENQPTEPKFENNLNVEQQSHPMDMSELEERQKSLLKKLEDLQNQIRNIKAHCIPKPSGSPAKSKSLELPKSTELDLPFEIVVNASPKFLPYSLLLLAKSLNGEIGLKVTHHVHSSVPMIEEISHFAKSLQENPVKNGNAALRVRLIIKDVGAHTELLAGSMMPVPISGEVNILRYIARLLKGYLPYDETVETDSLLDACYLLQQPSTPNKEKQLLLKSVMSYLSKNSNGQLSIVDLALFSVMRQAKLPGANAPQIQTWLNKCNNLVKVEC